MKTTSKAGTAYFAKKILKAQEAFDMECVRLGQEARTNVVLPFCRRFDLEFFSGNGDYFFRMRDGSTLGYFEETESAQLQKALLKVCSVLDIDIDAYNSLSGYIESVRYEDKEA